MAGDNESLVAPMGSLVINSVAMLFHCFTFPNALFIPPPAALALMAVAGGGDVLGDTGGGDVWDNWKNLFAQDIGQQ